MLMVPSIFGEDLFDDFMRFPTTREVSRSAYDEWAKTLMKTDIKEVGENYELLIDLPGYTKDEIKLHLKEGYLTIEAAKEVKEEKEAEESKYLHQERFYGSCSRTFQVGKGLTEEDVHAKFENGVLFITFPKEVKKPVEEKKYISIEG